MIIFYTKDVEEVVLASVVKHFNPHALLREYTDNNDIISIAKMYNDPQFIRIKDYKLAILNKYRFPVWLKNDSRIKFLELVLSHKDTNSNEVVSYVAKYLFSPEELFYSSLDKTNVFKNRASQVIKELNAFKRLDNKFCRKGITYYDINPEHDISRLLLDDLVELNEDAVIVLNKDEALIANAEKLGFDKKIVKTTRYDAFKLREKDLVKPAKKQIIKQTLATKICEF